MSMNNSFSFQEPSIAIENTNNFDSQLHNNKLKHCCSELYFRNDEQWNLQNRNRYNSKYISHKSKSQFMDLPKAINVKMKQQCYKQQVLCEKIMNIDKKIYNLKIGEKQPLLIRKKPSKQKKVKLKLSIHKKKEKQNQNLSQMSKQLPLNKSRDQQKFENHLSIKEILLSKQSMVLQNGPSRYNGQTLSQIITQRIKSKSKGNQNQSKLEQWE